MLVVARYSVILDAEYFVIDERLGSLSRSFTTYKINCNDASGFEFFCDFAQSFARFNF